jgi:hypothetical protein
MRAAILLLAALTIPAQAQWTIQTPTTADLRGIDNVGHGVAWASGTNGTVLRTEDAGYLWQTCTIPPGAEHLDFRGIQAFDANTAIVMSSGTGDQSRLYKTTDGCQTWKLVFTNPDKDGFWDTLVAKDGAVFLVGDPVAGRFPLWWCVPRDFSCPARYKLLLKSHREETAFAASNTVIFIYSGHFWLGTGGEGGARVIRSVEHGNEIIDWVRYPSSDVPVGQHTESSGIFSLAFALDGPNPPSPKRGIAVGGDYLKPNEPARTAAFTINGSKTWKPARTPPHRKPSAGANDAKTKTWITIGPNGTDISTDDGRNWRALHPTANEAPDADQHWNALSLPYAVGPHGRIGILNPSALKPQP